MKNPKQIRLLIWNTKQKTTAYTAMFMWREKVQLTGLDLEHPVSILTSNDSAGHGKSLSRNEYTNFSTYLWTGRLFFYLYSVESAMGISSLYLVHMKRWTRCRYLVVGTRKVSAPPRSMCFFLQCSYSLSLARNYWIVLSSVTKFCD